MSERELGRFITVEGSEGAGKSTNLEVICDTLAERGINFYRTREPGGTPLAEALRDALLLPRQESVDGITELLVVFAARNQHLRNEILPRLTRGEWVVCDRFTDASYAYQGAARGVSNDVIGFLEECVQGELRPDLTVYLDLDPAVGRQRIADREQDRLEQEQLGFFEAVRSGYLARAASEPYFRTVDASGTVEQVRGDIQLAINDFLDEVHMP